MGRFRREMYEDYTRQHFGEYSDDPNYNAAYRRVKRLKRFYSHLKIFIIVNIIIIVSSLTRDKSAGLLVMDLSGLTEWHTYSTAFFWGIGLLAHAMSVFGRDLFFSDDWEQKKIQKYMEKEAANTNKWE